MGNVCATAEPGEVYMAKQDVTIWNYSKGNNPNPIACQKNDEFFLLEGSKDQRWWHVQVKKDKKKTGYASHVYFYKKDTDKDYMKEPWYFGEIPRIEAEESLGQQNNPQGSYLVRWSGRAKKFVLDLRIYDDLKRDYYYRHFDVKRNKQETKYFFSKSKQFDTLIELIEHSTTNEQEGLPTKLTNVSLIQNPHADATFIRNKDLAVNADAWMVPRSELSFNVDTDKLGEGAFGVVYKALWRGNLQVAVKQLKQDGSEGSDKALKEFFAEKDLMTKLNHPCLVQLFAICMEEGHDNLLVQEFCSKGDLKGYLTKLDRAKKGPKHSKKHRPKADHGEASFEVLLNWCVQAASGMQHLESLAIIHRDLAARNVLLDSFLRAKVADFGLARDEEAYVATGGQIPIKWSPPEALFKNQFSHKSDVWSYGILMWEIFSLGDNPYPGVKNAVYKKKVKKGLRCDIPDYDGTSKENLEIVYKIMCACWNPEPMSRPTFETLRDDLDNFISTGEFEIDYDDAINYTMIDADGEPLYQD